MTTTEVNGGGGLRLLFASCSGDFVQTRSRYTLFNGQEELRSQYSLLRHYNAEPLCRLPQETRRDQFSARRFATMP